MADGKEFLILSEGESEARIDTWEAGDDGLIVKDAGSFDGEEFESDARIGGRDTADASKCGHDFFFAA